VVEGLAALEKVALGEKLSLGKSLHSGDFSITNDERDKTIESFYHPIIHCKF